jgi:hypothetical protein
LYKGVIGDLISTKDGVLKIADENVFNQTFKKGMGQERRIDQIYEILKRKPQFIQNYKESILQAYKNSVDPNNVGKVNLNAHQRFINDYKYALETFFGKNGYKEITTVGNLAKKVEATAARRNDLMKKLGTTTKGKLENLDPDKIFSYVYNNNTPTTTKKVISIIKEDKDLLNAFQTVTKNDLMFKTTDNRGKFVFEKFADYMKNNKQILTETFVDNPQYVKDLDMFRDALEIMVELSDTKHPQLKMLRALFLPNQALASELKDMTTSKSVGLTGEGQVFGPRVEDIEREQEQIKQVLKPGVSKPAVEPITKETFPAEPQQKPEPPIQPEIELKNKEEFPAMTENKPIIFEQRKDEETALIGTKAIEGGKEVKDITAGVSAQKDVVPSLLEQSNLAMPIKKFFEEDDQVINYKIGDTVGAYGDMVERSLDIEANVKPDFNIDKFGEVIKQRAKAFDQDAAFVAESVPSDFKGANVGFELDFGSNLKMQDALNFANLLSETATVDGFTFKVKNLDSSGASIYLPQTEKDLELIEKSLKRFGITDDIGKAGFIMPDGNKSYW